MKRFFRYFIGIVPFFAAEAIQSVVYIGFYALYSFFLGIKIGFLNAATGESDSTAMTQKIMEAMSQDLIYFFSVFAVIVCGVVFFFWYRFEIRGEVRGKSRQVFTPKNVVLFLMMGIGCQFFVTGVMSLMQPIFSKTFEDYAKTVESLLGGNDIIVLLLLIVIAPIAEELIFRGMILHKTSKEITFVGANLLQAILFGIYHWNIIQGVYATFIGFLLGLVYHKYRTIFAPILLHMIINASSLMMVLLPNHMVAYILISILGVLLLGGVLLKLRPFIFDQELVMEEVNSDKITFN